MSGTFHFMASPDGETIQEGTLLKGRHYRIEKGFGQEHYSREDIN